MNRMLQWIAGSGAVAAGAALAVWTAGPALGSGPVAPLAVEARAVALSTADPAATQVGRLVYLGGLQLSAKDIRFGGLSGLLWEPECKRLLAVSDSGAFVALEPEEAGDRLTGIRAAWIAPVKGPDGSAPASKRAADAEALARLSNGSSWVFYEQDHRAERFADLSACRPETLAATPDRRITPAEVADWPGNGGMEAAVGMGAQFLILAEAVPGRDGRRAGLRGPASGPFKPVSWDAPAGHDPTDMAELDPGSGNGRMLVLHRSFSPLAGVSVILSQGDFSEPVSAAVSAREVARLRPPLAVDNMEALAVRAEGERRFVYLLSDDNFNALQRTLLLKFELLPEPKAGP
jgi:hypothetical protein